jgi:hypothetical protein
VYSITLKRLVDPSDSTTAGRFCGREWRDDDEQKVVFKKVKSGNDGGGDMIAA